MSPQKRYQRWEEVAKLIEGIKTRGHLTFRDLMKIGVWKAALPAAYLTVNEPERIKAVTQKAIHFAQAGDIYRAMRELGQLEGMKSSLKMRSAVLAVACYPDFPVIDKWAYSALHGTDVSGNDPQIYVDYCKLVRRLAEQKGVTPKKMDEILMEMGKDKRVHPYRLE